MKSKKSSILHEENLLCLPDTYKRTLTLDFSFNKIRDIQTVPFSRQAPNHREVSDGLNAFFYCLNPSC